MAISGVAQQCTRLGVIGLTPRMIGAAVVLLALNVLVASEGVAGVLPDEFLEMLLMLGIFAAGVRHLLREAEFERLTEAESELVS